MNNVIEGVGNMANMLQYVLQYGIEDDVDLEYDLDLAD